MQYDPMVHLTPEDALVARRLECKEAERGLIDNVLWSETQKAVDMETLATAAALQQLGRALTYTPERERREHEYMFGKPKPAPKLKKSIATTRNRKASKAARKQRKRK